MVTELRKQRHIPQTATNSSGWGLTAVGIYVDGKKFVIQPEEIQPELYAAYLKRKDIDVDFSSAKTQEDIAILRENFAKKFKGFPSDTKLEESKEKYVSADNDHSYAAHIHDIAIRIIFDLVDTNNISDARYNNVLKYLKTIITAFADGKSVGEIDDMQEPDISIIKKIKREDLLRSTKHAIGDAIADPRCQKIPQKLILSLAENLPATRIRSAIKDPEKNSGVCKYMKHFETFVHDAMKKESKIYSELSVLLLQDKIRNDGLRTFDILAEHHLKKLEKEKSLEEKNKKTKALKDATKELNKKRGLAKQKVIHVGNPGPIDPVARRIAKMRSKNIEY